MYIWTSSRETCVKIHSFSITKEIREFKFNEHK